MNNKVLKNPILRKTVFAALLAAPVTAYGRLAEQILCEARSRTARPDDMTVGIVMIDRAACGAASA